MLRGAANKEFFKEREKDDVRIKRPIGKKIKRREIRPTRKMINSIARILGEICGLLEQS